MGKPEEPYYRIVVETYRISGSGLTATSMSVLYRASNFRRRFMCDARRRCGEFTPSVLGFEFTPN